MKVFARNQKQISVDTGKLAFKIPNDFEISHNVDKISQRLINPVFQLLKNKLQQSNYLRPKTDIIQHREAYI